jgi:hypothetical protein
MNRQTSTPTRFAAFVLLLAPLFGCESPPPAFPVPEGPPIHVALDVQFVGYTLGTWVIDEFSDALAEQLAKYNVKVVGKKAAADYLAEINLGVWGNRHAIDVYVVHDGQRRPAGRVNVPDLSWTTLDVSAQLVAPLIARQAWGLPSGRSPEE